MSQDTGGMEKRGVIDSNTPQEGCCGGNGGCPPGDPGEEGVAGQPTTKEAADSLDSGLTTDAVDAVADQTDANAAKK